MLLSPSASTSPSPLPLHDWLSAMSPLLSERRARPADLAHDLVAQGGSWNPRSGPLAVAGRMAETARLDLTLACAMTHHVRAALMLDVCGAGAVVNGTLLWGMLGTGACARPGEGWTVSGSLDTCCLPPGQSLTYVVLEHERGHVLTVPVDDADQRRSVVVSGSAPDGRARIDFEAAPARMQGPVTDATLTQVEAFGRVIEAAAWYGALTSLADALVASLQVATIDKKRLRTSVAEVDALLSASWAAIRDAVAVWERGPNAAATLVHHVARARTLTRVAATTVLFAYTALEDSAARGDGPSPQLREDLARWMGRADLDADSAVVAEAVLAEGPSW